MHVILKESIMLMKTYWVTSLERRKKSTINHLTMIDSWWYNGWLVDEHSMLETVQTHLSNIWKCLRLDMSSIFWAQILRHCNCNFEPFEIELYIDIYGKKVM
jgi:hypothetical protein